jgi:hypothetical protein
MGSEFASRPEIDRALEAIGTRPLTFAIVAEEGVRRALVGVLMVPYAVFKIDDRRHGESASAASNSSLKHGASRSVARAGTHRAKSRLRDERPPPHL